MRLSDFSSSRIFTPQYSQDMLQDAYTTAKLGVEYKLLEVE